MTKLRRTYLRAAEIVGAEVDESTVCYKYINDRYFISVSESFRGTVHINLIDTTIPVLDNRRMIATQTIRCGASDRVINNKLDRLLSNIH